MPKQQQKINNGWELLSLPQIINAYLPQLLISQLLPGPKVLKLTFGGSTQQYIQLVESCTVTVWGAYSTCTS